MAVLFLGASTLLGAAAPAGASADVPLVVVRRALEPGCTMGELRMGDELLGYTLERPPIANISYISSIPVGTYSAFVRTDGERGWRLELVGVPGRGNIQIHVGNFVDDTIGCVLVGTGAVVRECRLTGSRDAMARLRRAIESELSRDSEGRIQVTIQCEGAGC